MTGFVSLVGAGPGDPGLITVAAVDRVKRADVIVYDRLIPQPVLDEAPDDCELIYMGKIGGEQSHGQDAINSVLVEKGREGKRVVRLKGGDPFVFGRGGEEAEALRAASIPFEVIPGVTSAVAVPAYAGIPVTHRGAATSFAVVTGHEDPAKDESTIDWGSIAGVETLVLLMGVRTLPEIIEKLTAAGRAPDTPAAAIQWGTTPEQRTVTGTLADIVQRIEDAGLTPPAITVVGDVVRMRASISWFENRPLFGKRVLVTRTRKQASALAELLAAEGAIPVELPSIEVEPVTDDGALGAAIDALASGSYAWAVFTSANAVDVFFDALSARGRDARALAGAKIAAIGPATAAALAGRGIVADAVPDEYVAERVVDALKPNVSSGDRILLPRAAEARPELPEGLRALGAEVDEVPLYRSVVPGEAPPDTLEALREGRIDVVTFTSSSTVRNLVSMLSGDTSALNGALIACIGPITARTAEELGLTVDVSAKEYTVPGLVAAIREHCMEGGS
jgi:uroporphyrinogen III methyltransferase/synthase